MLFINVSPSVTFNLTLPHGTKDIELEKYELTMGDGTLKQWYGLDSRIIRLNGKLMDVESAEGLPPPLKVRTNGKAPLQVKPLSITFIISPAGFADDACS